jgi:uncharacterized protein
MLCDTGPLVAVLDATDPYHVVCINTLTHLPTTEPVVTTWPCLTEAMYLLYKLDGHRGQERLWNNIVYGAVEPLVLERASLDRMRMLMTKYCDTPMDFADASLVVTAEITGDCKIFTFDQHFRTYLIHDRIPFEVIP